MLEVKPVKSRINVTTRRSVIVVHNGIIPQTARASFFDYTPSVNLISATIEKQSGIVGIKAHRYGWYFFILLRLR